MEKVVKAFCSKYNIDCEKEKIVVAVSTGLDSMCLLTALRKVFSPENIIIAHVNHLRRAASTLEEAFIKAYAKEQGLACFTHHLPALKQASFQEEARKERLKFFKMVLINNQAKLLFFAHHLDDDLETFLMRLLRGSSLEAYSGMNEYYFEAGFFYLRPFLQTTKEQLYLYSKIENITYFEDASNQEDYYTRNRIRHNIIPTLHQESPQVYLKFREFKETLQGASEVVNSVINNWLDNYVRYSEEAFIFSCENYRSLSAFLQTEVLFRLLKKENLSRLQISSLKEIILSNKANHESVLNNLKMVKSYELITFRKNEGSAEFNEVILTGLGEYVINKDWSILISKKRCDSGCNLRNLWYNSTMLPIIARPRQDGDCLEFTYGTKKVKKILIDQKVPMSKRTTAIVLEKDDIILALLGYATSINLPATEQCDIVIELKENKI